MLDPTIIDERLREARLRDKTVFDRLLGECSRLVVVDQHQAQQPAFSLDSLCSTIRPARVASSGRLTLDQYAPPPDNGSFAYQLFSALSFAIDARAEVKLLELIASPTFYAALMRSAAEQPETQA